MGKKTDAEMVKMKFLVKLLPVMLMLHSPVHAFDDTLTVYEVYRWAERHFPLQNRDTLYDRSLQLKLENLQSQFLPEIITIGSVTYQSDVIAFPFEIPGADPLDLPHERLQAYLDVTQVIYDGGLTNLQKELARREAEIHKQQTDVSLQEIKEQVLSTYYAILVARHTEDILLNTIDLLKEKMEISRAAVEGGISDTSGVLELQAGIVTLEQQIAAARQRALSGIDALSVLTGVRIDPDTEFAIPEELTIESGHDLYRPELELLSLHQEKLRTAVDLQDAMRRPKVSAFGQGGVGYPNPYNLFDDTFSSFFLVGLRFSWRLVDWGGREREQEILRLQSDILQTEKDQFTQNIDVQLQRLYGQIEEMETVVESDHELIHIRQSIHDLASLQFDHGTISAGDYIEAVNHVQTANLNLVLHRTRLELAKALYLNQQGIFFTASNDTR